jgi:hypothetical protein
VHIQHPFHLPQRRWQPELVVTTRRLRLTRINLWSFAKVAFLANCFAAAMFAVLAIGGWAVLRNTGLISNIEGFLADVTGVGDFHLYGEAVFRSFAILLGGFVIAATAIAVAAASFFNLITQMTGGIDLDIKEMRETTSRPSVSRTP